MPLFPALRRQRQEIFDFFVNLVYIMSSRTSQDYIVFQKRINRWDVVIC